MTSSQNNSGMVRIKADTSNIKILSDNNPEIFGTSPRPGGFVRISAKANISSYPPPDDPEYCSTCESKRPPTSKTAEPIGREPARSTISREFRLKQVINDADWGFPSLEEVGATIGYPSPHQDGINMLAVTISCVMLLAAKIETPQEQMIWAYEYLKCIRDEHGNHPPNVARILKEIELLNTCDSTTCEEKKGTEGEVEAEPE